MNMDVAMKERILDSLLIKMSSADRYFLLREFEGTELDKRTLTQLLQGLVNEGYATEYPYGDGRWKLTPKGVSFIKHSGYSGIENTASREAAKKEEMDNLDIAAKKSQIRHNSRSYRVSIIAIIISVISLGVAVYSFLQHK